MAKKKITIDKSKGKHKPELECIHPNHVKLPHKKNFPMYLKFFRGMCMQKYSLITMLCFFSIMNFTTIIQGVIYQLLFLVISLCMLIWMNKTLSWFSFDMTKEWIDKWHTSQKQRVMK